jgi:glycosyltransferase involved in cell wall biosynthesis
MACARPVVATGAGGSGEFLTDEGNCLRFSAGDPHALVDALIRLAGDPALRQRLVRRGIDTASQLTMDRLTDELEARFLSAASGRPIPTPNRGAALE